MKKTLIALLMCLPLLTGAQQKIKETDVPRSVLLSLERTYESYKVKTWYQAPGQYIADFVTDGQDGRCYFTNLGDWQYSAFPVKLEECPTLMNTYFVNNYPGYRIKSTDYIEEMSGDNYYRLIIVKKGVGSKDCELIFDTRGKLQKSTAPDPDAVKRDYYTHNNPEETFDTSKDKAEREQTEKKSRHHAKRDNAEVDAPKAERPMPSDAIMANFNKRYPSTRLKSGPEWYQRGDNQFVAYFTNNQKNQFECVYDNESEKLIKTGKILLKERYPSTIKKYLDEKFYGEKYKIEKMVTYEFDAKYRGADGKKPKPYTYVVVSQKNRDEKRVDYTRLEFDHTGKFIGLLAQPLDTKDIQ
ncbi:MAG: hypothetical protein SPJ13_02790 [Bacteroidales bacterium]|nr:hypothetical protein [Bacteroidales bacterium]